MAAKKSGFPLKPLDDHIIIVPDPLADTTPGGIALPDSAKEDGSALVIGTVAAVGRGSLNANGKVEKPEVKVGDRVYYSKYSDKIKLGDKEYFIVRSYEIKAVFVG